MKIGFVGLGKLGLPCAIAISAKNHDVIGYDINPEINSESKIKDIFHANEADENGIGSADNMIENTKLKIVDTLDEIITNSDIIFIAVQTPHEYIYEGCDVMPEERRDFDYTYLINCFVEISKKIEMYGAEKIIIIISTVLPGTLRKYILPILPQKIKLCYNPYFIAMGTVIYDFYNPEFILLGTMDTKTELKVKEFYKTITNAEVYSTTIENAEIIKVSYNTFITTKIVLTNNLMEMCHTLPNTNIDDVMFCLKKASRRIISGAYLNGGMGDGGGCHPRDNIAMSWLSNKLGIKNNYYDFIMRKRESQTDFFADIIEKQMNCQSFDVIILGTAFKPQTNIETGSTAILLKNLLLKRNIQCKTYDPYINKNKIELMKGIYFIGCKHEIFKTYNFDAESIIIDPHRYISKKENIKVIWVGVGEEI